MISPIQYRSLLAFPETEFGSSASARWSELCEELRTFSRSAQALEFPRARKWELVSALQKAIRRGDHELTVQLIAKVEGVQGEKSYFWRRLPVIACEDIGVGDADLTIFSLACSQVFTPARSQAVLLDVFAFLAEKMCSAAKLSRTACDLACIRDNLRANAPQSLLRPEDEVILAAIENRTRELNSADTKWRIWQRKNDWRGSNLLRFHDMNLPLPLRSSRVPLPLWRLIDELPSYCYDMYTRIGRSVLNRLLAGVEGAEHIRHILTTRGVREPLTAAGEALFFEEGGLLRDEVGYDCVADLNQRLFASHFGLDLDRWRQLRVNIRAAVDSGIVDLLREEEVSRRYAQLPLFLL